MQLALRLVLNEYIWAWTVGRTPADGTGAREVFKQNSVADAVVDPAVLHRRAAVPPPRLGSTGGAVLSLLTRMDGRATLAELAEAVHRESPTLFPSLGAASAFVTEWTIRVAHADAGIGPANGEV